MRLPDYKNKSVMKYDFEVIPEVSIPRSIFNRSHGYKSMFDAEGLLYPIYFDEALPGDTFNLNMTAVMRLASQLNLPIMDSLQLDFFFFAVPCRLLWDNFKKFMGERVDPGDSIDYTIPVNTTPPGGYAENSLYDYFGIPPLIDDIDPAALHIRAYSMIWNQHFRDQNLQDSVVVDTDDGPDTASDYNLLKRGKRFDYFTSCLPWPMKENTSVDLPLGDWAQIVTRSTDRTFVSAETPMHMWDPADGTYTAAAGPIGLAVGGDVELNTGAWAKTEDAVPSNLWADLANATAASLTDLRTATALQHFLEMEARGGTRYPEQIKNMFGVTSPDSRMQRSEYLGGGSTIMQINSIPATADMGLFDPGELVAIGSAQSHGIGFTKSFTEHCVLIGLVSCSCPLTYTQGLDRMWSRSTRYDFFWPAFQHLSEQEVLSKEIYIDGTANDDDVFGYNERYAEYRSKRSCITGVLRPDNTVAIDEWHLSEDFGSRPVLNSTFIQMNNPVDRIVTVTSQPHVVFDAYFDLTCTRPMAVRGIPGLTRF